jgi:hypothetical protein
MVLANPSEELNMPFECLLSIVTLTEARSYTLLPQLTCAISSVVEMPFARLLRVDTTVSTAKLMPRRKSIGFMPDHEKKVGGWHERSVHWCSGFVLAYM